MRFLSESTSRECWPHPSLTSQVCRWRLSWGACLTFARTTVLSKITYVISWFRARNLLQQTMRSSTQRKLQQREKTRSRGFQLYQGWLSQIKSGWTICHEKPMFNIEECTRRMRLTSTSSIPRRRLPTLPSEAEETGLARSTHIHTL